MSVTTDEVDEALLWPAYADPADLAAIEAIPLEQRGLPATTYDVLRRAARRWPHRTAVAVMPDASRWRDAATQTFGDLEADVVRVANVLHDFGVRRHDVVALMSPNCQQLISATLAAELAGIAGPVNPALEARHVADLLARSGARTLIAAGPDLDQGVWDRAVDLARAGAVDTLFALAPTAADGTLAPLPEVPGVVVRYLGSLRAHEGRNTFVGEEPDPDDIAAIFHTGGTTGVPKLAAHTHANQVIDGWAIAVNSSLDDDSVLLGALPLFHVNALMVTLIAPMLRGQQVVWAGPLGFRDPAFYGQVWHIVEHFKVSTMSGVPTVYQVLAGCPVDADISSVRFALVGASPLPPAVRTAFESATGIPLLEGYGLTEATCASARSFVDAPRPGSVGQRMPYQQARIVRGEDWTDVPTGELGTLLISGPTVFAGYVTGRSDSGLLTAGMGKLRDGWLDTGDLARLDADGFIHLAGRAKDLIIRGGHNIDPAAIEDALLAHPDVVGAGAVGRPDRRAGEVPVAFVTLAPGSSASAEDLVRWAAEHVPEAAASPKTVTVVDELPVTAVGKPYKVALRAEAARAEVSAALSGLPGVAGVVGAVENGSVVVVVQVKSTEAEAAVAEILNGYALSWRTEASR